MNFTFLTLCPTDITLNLKVGKDHVDIDMNAELVFINNQFYIKWDIDLHGVEETEVFHNGKVQS